MPPRGKREADATYDLRMQEAIRGLANGKYDSIQQAAKEHNVKRSTLHDRMRGRHKPMSKHAESQRTLNPDEETILLDWACLNSASATPLRVTDLRSIASDICGAVPGDKWARGFLKRHKDTLIKHTPCNLDPKRARNFNKTIVTDYFNLRRDIEERYGPIPPEHHYNMDEKGVRSFVRGL